MREQLETDSKNAAAAAYIGPSGVAAEGRRGNKNLWLLPYAKVIKFIGSYTRKVLHEV